MEACEENVRGDLQDDGPALEKDQVWDGRRAEGQFLLSQVQIQVGDGRGMAEGQLLLGQV